MEEIYDFKDINMGDTLLIEYKSGPAAIVEVTSFADERHIYCDIIKASKKGFMDDWVGIIPEDFKYHKYYRIHI